MIIHLGNLKSEKRFGLRHKLKVCTGAHYLDGFIGDDESSCDWSKEITQTWEYNIHKTIETTGKYP